VSVVANNIENLRTPTTEEAREIGKKGGIASGKARRKKKELKQLLELALSQPHIGSEDGEDNWTAICVAQVQKALSGDTRAFETIRDTIGQKPTEEQDVNMKAKITVDYGDD
jgi:hypothetical protein